MRITFKLEGTVQLPDNASREDGEFVRVLVRKNVNLSAEQMETVTRDRPFAFVEVRSEVNQELPSP